MVVLSFAKQPLHTAFDTSPVQSSTVIANISPHHSIPPLFTPLLIPLRHSFISPRHSLSLSLPPPSLLTILHVISLHSSLFISPLHSSPYVYPSSSLLYLSLSLYLSLPTTPHHSSQFPAYSHFTHHFLSPFSTPPLMCIPLRHSFISPCHS